MKARNGLRKRRRARAMAKSKEIRDYRTKLNARLRCFPGVFDNGHDDSLSLRPAAEVSNQVRELPSNVGFYNLLTALRAKELRAKAQGQRAKHNEQVVARLLKRAGPGVY